MATASSPATARRSTAPAAPRLRDSCHACAASKVKCSKEKPTCARCAKRGLDCEYCVTKRAGRKRDPRPNNTIDVAHELPGSSSSSSSDTATIASTNPMQPSPNQQTPGYPDMLPSLLTDGDYASSSMFSTLSTDFDDFFASPMSFSLPEMSDAESLGQAHMDPRSVNNNSMDPNSAAALFIPDDAFSILDDTVSDGLPMLSKPRSPPNSHSSTTSETPSLSGFRLDSSCCCLMRALGYLTQLFPNASTACARSKRQGYEDTTCQLPTIQSVIAENEQIIEAISTMLHCPCSHDGYLLAIMSLIVFKVLGWYAAAARETPMASDGNSSPTSSLPGRRRRSTYHCEEVLQFPTTVGSYCIGGDDQGRMAAQLVLSELHRVQRLVNQLSHRLKGQGMRNGPGTPNSSSDGQETTSELESTLPFSATMLDQLETDLRKRLRSLSLEIVEMLRRG